MATRGRGRRLTMAFRPQPPSPAETSARGASSGSRYSCLGSESGSSDEESPPAVGVQMALDILDQEEENSGWTPVGRTRRKRTEAEIVQQFWVDAGFPTPASRFPERRTSSPPATPTANAGMEPSSCRDQEIYVVEGSPGREQSHHRLARRRPDYLFGRRLRRRLVFTYRAVLAWAVGGDLFHHARSLRRLC